MAPTQLDKAMQSKTLFWGFVGVIGVVAAYSIWGGNVFPQVEQKAAEIKSQVKSGKAKAKATDPTGEPQQWTEEEMEGWLKGHNVTTTGHETKEELLAMVSSTMHAPA